MIEVMVGGAFGAVGRYMISLAFSQKNNTSPFATFFINLSGSALLGVFIALFTQEQQSYLFLGIGFMGAFTTFSTFSVEALELIRKNNLKMAVFYVSTTLIGIIICFNGGFFVTQWFLN